MSNPILTAIEKLSVQIELEIAIYITEENQDDVEWKILSRLQDELSTARVQLEELYKA